MTADIRTNDNSSTLAQCISRRSGGFNEKAATSDFIFSQENLTPDPVWDSFNPHLTNAGNTTIQLASNIALSSYIIALAITRHNSSVLQLGLNGLSLVAGFGLLAGSQSVQQPRDGHMVYEGYDADSFAGHFATYSTTTLPGSTSISSMLPRPHPQCCIVQFGIHTTTAFLKIKDA